MRYAREENGQIKRYSSLPRITEYNGQTIMNVRSLSSSELADIGFYPLVLPNYNPLTEKLGTIVWDSTQYTYAVEDIETNLAAAKKRLYKRVKEDILSVHLSIETYKSLKGALGENIPGQVQNKINTFYGYVKDLRNDISDLSTIEQVRLHTIDRTKLETARIYFEGLL